MIYSPMSHFNTVQTFFCLSLSVWAANSWCSLLTASTWESRFWKRCVASSSSCTSSLCSSLILSRNSSYLNNENLINFYSLIYYNVWMIVQELTNAYFNILMKKKIVKRFTISNISISVLTNMQLPFFFFMSFHQTLLL